MTQEASLHSIKFGDKITTTAEEASKPLRLCVQNSLLRYFKQLDGQDTSDLYKLVMAEVEAPLFKAVLDHVGGNQTRAAGMLGISRSTLRKKLTIYDLDN